MSWFDNQLIALIKENECLYSKNDKNTRQRYEAWRKIANQLGTTMNKCQLRWDCLREDVEKRWTTVGVSNVANDSEECDLFNDVTPKGPVVNTEPSVEDEIIDIKSEDDDNSSSSSKEFIAAEISTNTKEGQDEEEERFDRAPHPIIIRKTFHLPFPPYANVFQPPKVVTENVETALTNSTSNSTKEMEKEDHLPNVRIKRKTFQVASPFLNSKDSVPESAETTTTNSTSDSVKDKNEEHSERGEHSYEPIKKKRFVTTSAFTDKFKDSTDVPAILETTTPKSTIGDDNTISMLKEILQNQNKMLANLGSLESRISSLEQNIREKSNEVHGQNKMIRKCNVIITKVQRSLSRITGDDGDDKQTEVAISLPLTTVDEVVEEEEKLQCQEHATAVKIHIFKLKGPLGEIGEVMRRLFTDELLMLYNWNGRHGKRALKELSLVNGILYDVFKTEGYYLYQKSIKRCIELSHLRYRQMKCSWKKKNASNVS